MALAGAILAVPDSTLLLTNSKMIIEVEADGEHSVSLWDHLSVTQKWLMLVLNYTKFKDYTDIHN